MISGGGGGGDTGGGGGGGGGERKVSRGAPASQLACVIGSSFMRRMNACLSWVESSWGASLVVWIDQCLFLFAAEIGSLASMVVVSVLKKAKHACTCACSCWCVYRLSRSISSCVGPA